MMILDPYRYGDPTRLLLVKGNGADGGTVFTDSSIYARTPTVVGAITTAAAGDFYEGSGVKFVIGASANYLQFTEAGGFLASTTAEFTIECWLRQTDVSSSEGYSDGRYSVLRLTDGATKRVEIAGSFLGSSEMVIATPGAQAVSVGNVLDRVHLAITRWASDSSLHVNGVLATTPGSNPVGTFNFTDIYIGNTALTSRTTGGFIEDVCLTAGAKYSTANFTPPGSL